ncbi:MAG TPA: ABC transporter ATP-binding protein [Chitinophagales bacterium]|nr:ABC transporter ATP-binding protein [Chitinophagales bacterium]
MHLIAQDIHKRFGNEAVLQGIHMSIQQGHTLSILGKSGCGKTTLLKILAGLIPADSGKVLLEDIDVTQTAPQVRQIVYLYQEPLLFPHLTVFDNIAFGLRIRKLPEDEVHQQTFNMLDALGMRMHSDKRPSALSGGQRQRVAFGRAIVIKPKVLLLDEPFGSLDAETRQQMQSLFKQLVGTYQITSVFVTHDIKEALLMGDHFSFMRNGTLTTYGDKSQFMQDKETGVAQELQFWQNIV